MLIVPDNLSLAPYCKSSDFCDDNRLIIADKEVLSCATIVIRTAAQHREQHHGLIT